MTNHSIDIEADDVSGVAILRAVCPCGYVSRDYSRNQDAKRAGTAHVDSLQSKRLAFWQGVPCPAWCTVDHRDYDLRGTRWHLSQWSTVDRPTLDAIRVRSGQGGYRPRRLGVRLEQGANDSGFGGNASSVMVEVAGEITDGVFATDSQGPAVYLRVPVSVGLNIAEIIRQACCIGMGQPMYDEVEVVSL